MEEILGHMGEFFKGIWDAVKDPSNYSSFFNNPGGRVFLITCFVALLIALLVRRIKRRY